MKNRKLYIFLHTILILFMLVGCKNQKGKEQFTDVLTKSKLEKTNNIPESKGLSSQETTASETEAAEKTESTDASHNAQVSQEQTTVSVETSQSNIPDQKIPEYSYIEITNVMYAVSAVNVRSMPSVSGERIGTLKAGQEILVTGQCNETGWYRVSFNEQIGYVSNNYLETEKPTQKPTEKLTERQTEKSVIETSSEQKTFDQQVSSGLIAQENLANRNSLKKRCTNEEFQAAYNAAIQIVTPLIGLSREEQLKGIAIAIREMFDSGQVKYSQDAAHYDDPYGYLILGVGSCAECARTTGLCLNMLNIPYEHVNENQWSHQWCRVNVNGIYWICDAYGLYVGPEPEPYMHPYIN